MVAFDAVASTSFQGVTSASVNLTASGSDRVAVASIGTLPAAASVSSVTYGGAGMTLIDTETNTTLDGSANLFRYVAPATSSQSCQVNFAAAAYGGFGVMSFTGVDQTTPVSNFNGAQGNGLPTATVTVTSAIGEMGGDSLCTYFTGSAPTTGAGQTLRFHQSDAFGDRGAGSTEAGASSVTMSWTGIGGSEYWAITAASLKEATGGGAATSLLIPSNPMAHMLIR